MLKNVIPCVGFELQYSPLDRDCVSNLAASLLSAAHEFTFETIRRVRQGQKILLAFSNSNSPTQYLLAIVMDCTKLGEESYRLSLVAEPGTGVIADDTNTICIPICKGTSTAMEMILACPSCNKRTLFRFIANQQGDWDKGILPIYNCTSCGTSRAMIGLVNGNN